jgi:hypothetical protein
MYSFKSKKKTARQGKEASLVPKILAVQEWQRFYRAKIVGQSPHNEKLPGPPKDT